MKYGSLFSGIGGFDLGLDWAGMTCAWQVEKDEFCLKVLAKHWPDVTRYKDVKDVGKHNLEPVDLICGGFPCQDVSIIGKRKGLKGKRSTLWSEFYRIICELKPRWVVIENTTGLYSSDDGRFFAKILRELSQSGYNAEWDTIPASVIGATHRRERVFIVAHTDEQQRERRREAVYLSEKGTPGRRQGSNNSNGLCVSSRSWDTSPISLLQSIEERLQEIRALPTWESEPQIRRVVDGFPGRLDQLGALGNAVVPQLAQLIGRLIMEVDAAK